MERNNNLPYFERQFTRLPKTSYTYADSGSYRPIDADQPFPNMSRRRVGAAHDNYSKTINYESHQQSTTQVNSVTSTSKRSSFVKNYFSFFNSITGNSRDNRTSNMSDTENHPITTAATTTISSTNTNVNNRTINKKRSSERNQRSTIGNILNDNQSNFSQSNTATTTADDGTTTSLDYYTHQLRSGRRFGYSHVNPIERESLSPSLLDRPFVRNSHNHKEFTSTLDSHNQIISSQVNVLNDSSSIDVTCENMNHLNRDDLYQQHHSRETMHPIKHLYGLDIDSTPLPLTHTPTQSPPPPLPPQIQTFLPTSTSKISSSLSQQPPTQQPPSSQRPSSSSFLHQQKTLLSSPFQLYLTKESVGKRLCSCLCWLLLLLLLFTIGVLLYSRHNLQSIPLNNDQQQQQSLSPDSSNVNEIINILKIQLGAHDRDIQVLKEKDIWLVKKMEDLNKAIFQLQESVPVQLKESLEKWTEMYPTVLTLIQTTNNNQQTINQLLENQQDLSLRFSSFHSSTDQLVQRVNEIDKNITQWKNYLFTIEDSINEDRMNLQVKIQNYETYLSTNQPFLDETMSKKLLNDISSLYNRLAEVELALNKVEKLQETINFVQKPLENLQNDAQFIGLVEKICDKSMDISALNDTLTRQVNEILIKYEQFDNSKTSTFVDCSSGNCVTKLIHDALEIYSADKLAQPDYALESAGGSVIATRCTRTYSEKPSYLTVFGVPLLSFYRSPRTLIQPSVNPGECYAFHGSHGQIVLQLSMEIHISGVTLEHIPKAISPTHRIDSAPKDFNIKGLKTSDAEEGLLLGNFTYTENGPPVQTFNIALSEDSYRFVEIEFTTNHGHPDYTCVYRVRIHGQPVE